MITIHSNKFRAEINEHGAELTHLINLSENYDYIWNGDLWPKHAPVLFPAIGRSNNDSYLYDGKHYDMPQHGFASDSDFSIIDKRENYVSLLLTDSEKTRYYYPFSFRLVINFELKNNGLSVSFNVKNIDKKELSFSLGYHPAFNVPLFGKGKFNDYQVKIDPELSQLNIWEIIKKPYPYRTGKLVPMPGAKKSIINLDYSIFQKGLLIIENKGLKSAELINTLDNHSIKVLLNDFRYLCLWTKEDAFAPFLCLEGFNGLPDVYGKEQNLEEKEGNFHLVSSKEKKFNYQIILN